MNRPKLYVIVASTRDGRQGRAVADWAFEQVLQHDRFDAELVDLKEVNLPLFNEPRHPRLRQYEHAHTQAWSARIEKGDAFVIVTPEYNYGSPPSLLNAFDYLVHEWAYKPVGFVSYGGLAAGTRSVQMTKQVLSALKMVPIPEGVAIPLFTKQIEDGVFRANDAQQKAAATLLAELLRWTEALKVLRA
jgi:NAD(P)H-dependent FMN reductase